MKKLYTIGIALSMVAFGTQTMAQVKVQSPSSSARIIQIDEVKSVTSEVTNPVTKKMTPIQKDDVEPYFSEDFSNGILGQGDNGAWTVGEAQGALWFHTFPAEIDGGYTPGAAILDGTDPNYGTKLPYFYGATQSIVNSPSRDNGVMMVDLDRWNSLSTVENPLEFDPDLPESNFMTVDSADATLISPSIDLTGVEYGALTFYQRMRVCCPSGAEIVRGLAFVEISVDGQNSWEQFELFDAYGGEVNDNLEVAVVINISDVLQEAANLDNVHIRFNLSGAHSHYYWMIDDVQIIPLPENNLVGGATYLNNWPVTLNTVAAEEEGSYFIGQLSYAEYYAGFEYENQPNYYVRPFNFGMEARNNGATTQEDVILTVVGTAPSGATHTWTSIPKEIETGVQDTLWINDANLTDFDGGVIETGLYSFTFRIDAIGEDAFPDDNIGAPRSARISDDTGTEGNAVMQNSLGFGYLAYDSDVQQNGNDMINATGYVFPELADGYGPKFITHVETVFLGNFTLGSGFSSGTVAGEEVFFNVRKNHPINEVEEDPSTYALPIFGDEDLTYELPELRYIIQPGDISSVGGPYEWVSFELPAPVAIEADVVYMAELRVPATGNPIVWLAGSSGTNNEPFGSWIYYIGEETSNWGPIMALRFRTGDDATGIEKISVESGLTLIQNYPNPFTDMTNIQYILDESSSVKFEVRDLTGKLVHAEDLGSIPANLPQTIELQRGNLAAGMYTYSIVTPKGQVSRKLTVQ